MRWSTLLFSLGALVACAPSVSAQDRAKVDVTIKIPAKTQSFTNLRLVVMLYHNDLNEDERRVAVDRYIDAKFAHTQGKETVVKVTLGQNAALKPNLQYTLTATVFQGGSKRTHFSECDGREGPFVVLSDGRTKINLVLRPAAP